MILAVLLLTVGESVAQEGRKVSGVVVAAATQAPVVNASVQYEESDGTRQTTLTDAKGNFEFPH